MKNIVWIVGLFFVISCSNAPTDHVKLSGKLNVDGVKSIKVQGKNYLKDINIAEDGSFSDTLIVKPGIHAIANGKDRVTLFLRNGYDLKVTLKGATFGEGVEYSGEGASTNNYMSAIEKFFTGSYGNPKTYFNVGKEEFESKLKEAKGLLVAYESEFGEVDSLVISMGKRNQDRFFEYIESNYESMHAVATKLAKGKPSPVFENYENFAGGNTSLSDLKGKYVYIDVWATWCAPCKAEIPYLKALEEEFKGKNIEFVSISVDTKEAYDTWKTMVKDENLGGVQLYADNNFKSQFVVDYGINAIPRFILIDPEGNIVEANAERPSNPELKELLLELGI